MRKQHEIGDGRLGEHRARPPDREQQPEQEHARRHLRHAVMPRDHRALIEMRAVRAEDRLAVDMRAEERDASYRRRM